MQATTKRVSKTVLRTQLGIATERLLALGVTRLAYDPATTHLCSPGQLASQLCWAVGTIEHIEGGTYAS
jgi:hypothetical protein